MANPKKATRNKIATTIPGMDIPATQPAPYFRSRHNVQTAAASEPIQPA
jgi:hypothetical protein